MKYELEIYRRATGTFVGHLMPMFDGEHSREFFQPFKPRSLDSLIRVTHKVLTERTPFLLSPRDIIYVTSPENGWGTLRGHNTLKPEEFRQVRKQLAYLTGAYIN